MVSRKEIALQGVAVHRSSPPPLQRASKLPQPLPFILATVLSLFLSTVLYSFRVSVFGGSDLAEISRSPGTWVEPATSLGLRTLELGLAWYNGYDDYDLASLVALSRTPYLYLLFTFYQISPETIFSILAIDIASVWLPTFLLRPRIPSHDPHASAQAVANHGIIHSSVTTFTTALLPAAVYAATLSVALVTFLPEFLVVHLDGLRTVELAHRSQLPVLLAILIPLGYAAQKFLFTPSLGAKKDLGDIVASSFNPASASLGETFRYNVWGWSKRVRVLLARSVVLAIVVIEHTTEKVYGTLEGSDLTGALGYSTLWASAGLITALAYAWIGDV